MQPTTESKNVIFILSLEFLKNNTNTKIAISEIPMIVEFVKPLNIEQRKPRK